MRSPLARTPPSGERSDRKPWTSPSTCRTTTGSEDATLVREQEGHGEREEETISWFHCDSSTPALKPRPKAAKAGGCVVPQRHARQQFMSGCAAAACYCTITLRGKPARRWFHQKQRSSIWPRSAWRQGAQTQRRNRDHIPDRHA